MGQFPRLDCSASDRLGGPDGQQPERTRAKALQEASLAMMQRQSDGTPTIGYGHPMFWAPFVLVVDGD
jgi:CHAT domain-containing protein